MTDARFKIVFDGELMPEVSLDAAKDNLARLFKSDRTKIDGLFSGAAVALKRDLQDSEADKYLNALGRAGVRVRKERDLAASLRLVELEDPKSKTTTARMTCPKCDHEQMQAAACEACGIVVEKFLARQALLPKNPPPAPVEANPTPSPYTPPQSEVGATPPEFAELEVFTVQGRIGRLRYLAWSLALMAAAIALGGLAGIAFNLSNIAGGVLVAAVLIAMTVVSVMIGVQRLHDIGWSGWLLLVPGVALVMMFIGGTGGANRFGPPPPPNGTGVKVLGLLWLLVPVLGILAAIAIPAYQDYLVRTGL